MPILQELKRRNVIRVAVTYLAVAWMTIQVVDVLGSMLRLPEWLGPLVLVVLAVGLVVALALSWAYEITPEGVVQDPGSAAVEAQDGPARDPAALVRARRLNGVTVAAAVVAILFIVVDRLLPEAGDASDSSGAPVAVAVLPFVNLDVGSLDDSFADGITEEVLILLSKVHGLRVTSRTSAFSFKDQQVDLPTIAIKLGVSHVVEGSVRSAGNKVRISAQLIEVASDANVWSQSWERELEDVFAIQSELAAQIAQVLSTALSAEELALIGQRPTSSLSAWQRFVEARQLYRNRNDQEKLHSALLLVEAALSEDPEFARAEALHAAILLDQSGLAAKPSEMQAKLDAATVAADRALELLPALGEPYYIKAELALRRNDYTEAMRLYKRGVELAPNSPEGRSWYGEFLASAGYLARGWSEMLQAAALDPLSRSIAWRAAFVGLTAGQLHVVADYADKARENGWSGYQPKALAAGAAAHQGKLDEAEELFIKALAGAGPVVEANIRRSTAAIRARHIDPETRKMLDGLAPYGPPGMGRFPVEVQSGDLDAAFLTAGDLLDPASHVQPDGSGGPVRQYDGWPVPVLRGDWWFPGQKPFRQDPRFAELVTAVGLLRLWQQEGWPDLCRIEGGSLVCK